MADVEEGLEETLPRQSRSQQVSAVARSLSQAAINKSSGALHQVGSCLGVSQEGSHLDLWKEQTDRRAKSGQIGLHVSVSGQSKAASVDQAINVLEESLSKLSSKEHSQCSLEASSSKQVGCTSNSKGSSIHSAERTTSPTTSRSHEEPQTVMPALFKHVKRFSWWFSAATTESEPANTDRQQGRGVEDSLETNQNEASSGSHGNISDLEMSDTNKHRPYESSANQLSTSHGSEIGGKPQLSQGSLSVHDSDTDIKDPSVSLTSLSSSQRDIEGTGPPKTTSDNHNGAPNLQLKCKMPESSDMSAPLLPSTHSDVANSSTESEKSSVLSRHTEVSDPSRLMNPSLLLGSEEHDTVSGPMMEENIPQENKDSSVAMVTSANKNETDDINPAEQGIVQPEIPTSDTTKQILPGSLLQQIQTLPVFLPKASPALLTSPTPNLLMVPDSALSAAQEATFSGAPDLVNPATPASLGGPGSALLSAPPVDLSTATGLVPSTSTGIPSEASTEEHEPVNYARRATGMLKSLVLTGMLSSFTAQEVKAVEADQQHDATVDGLDKGSNSSVLGNAQETNYGATEGSEVGEDAVEKLSTESAWKKALFSGPSVYENVGWQGRQLPSEQAKSETDTKVKVTLATTFKGAESHSAPLLIKYVGCDTTDIETPKQDSALSLEEIKPTLRKTVLRNLESPVKLDTADLPYEQDRQMPSILLTDLSMNKDSSSSPPHEPQVTSIYSPRMDHVDRSCAKVNSASVGERHIMGLNHGNQDFQMPSIVITDMSSREESSSCQSYELQVKFTTRIVSHMLKNDSAPQSDELDHFVTDKMQRKCAFPEETLERSSSKSIGKASSIKFCPIVTEFSDAQGSSTGLLKDEEVREICLRDPEMISRISGLDRRLSHLVESTMKDRRKGSIFLPSGRGMHARGSLDIKGSGHLLRPTSMLIDRKGSILRKTSIAGQRKPRESLYLPKKGTGLLPRRSMLSRSSIAKPSIISSVDDQFSDLGSFSQLPSCADDEKVEIMEKKQSVLQERLHAEEQEDENSEFMQRKVALNHYKKFIQFEKRAKHMKVSRLYEEARDDIEDKLDHLEEAMEAARAHYSEPHGLEPGAGWKNFVRRLRGREDEMESILVKHDAPFWRKIHIRRQLEEMPTFKPWFTVTISVLHLVALIIIMAVGGLTTIQVEPQLQLREGVQTFRGVETVEHWIIPNPWIGPAASFIIGIGGMFSPCMRDDIAINAEYLRTGIASGLPLGCCEVQARHVAGTTFEGECSNISLVSTSWQEGVLCSERSASNILVPQVIMPCCHGLRGQCWMTSHEHCVFLEGSFHGNGPDHCSQVNCLSGLCGMGGLPTNATNPYRPLGPHQWWRLLLAMFYHHGIIHGLLTVILQLLIGWKIEVIAGGVRLGAIYFVSLIMGLLTGAVFSPYVPHVGATAAVAGLLAVILVEIVQSWKVIRRPWLEVIKVMAAASLLFISGTLPFVDNFEVIGGFCFGGLAALVFLPYITFGWWHAVGKRIIIVGALLVSGMLCLLIFHMFYAIQTMSETCMFCQWINCIPYSKNMCNVNELW